MPLASSARTGIVSTGEIACWGGWFASLRKSRRESMHLITAIARLWTFPMRLCVTAYRSRQTGCQEAVPFAGDYAVEFYLSTRDA